jgi:hypothetical protein
MKIKERAVFDLYGHKELTIRGRGLGNSDPEVRYSVHYCTGIFNLMRYLLGQFTSYVVMDSCVDMRRLVTAAAPTTPDGFAQPSGSCQTSKIHFGTRETTNERPNERQFQPSRLSSGPRHV